MKLVRATLYKLPISYKWKAYRFSKGREFTTLDNVVVRLETDTGVVGYGEANATPSYMGETCAGLLSAIGYLCPRILGENALEPRRLFDRLEEAMPGNYVAKSAIDTAVHDVMGRALGQPLAVLLGGSYRESFAPHWTLPMGTVEEVVGRARDLFDGGVTEFELKMGAGNPADDIALVKALRKDLGRGALFVVDPNEAWSPFEAVRVITELDPLDVFVEQPCRGIEALAFVRQKVRSPIIADESATSLLAVIEIVKHRAADVVCLKPPRIGGITTTLQVRDYCESVGLPVKLETDAMTKIGSAAAVHLIASLRAPFSPGGANFEWFDPDVAPGSLPMFERGRIVVPTGPGLGVGVDEALLGEPVASYGAVQAVVLGRE